MAYVVSSLPDYVENNKELISKNVAEGAPTLRKVTIQRGVKGSAYLNFLNVSAPWQSGSGCSFDQNGSATFTQRTITTALIKKDMILCPDTLIGKWPEYEARIPADKRDYCPFEAYIVSEIVNATAEEIEKAIWQGDTTSEDANLSKFDGWIKKINAEATAIKQTIASGTSAYSALKATIGYIPAKVLKKGASIFVSPEFFLQFGLEMVEKNFFHYAPDAEVSEFYFPGTNVKVVKTNGLANTLKIVATWDKNLYYGTDDPEAQQRMKVVYDNVDDAFKLKLRWNSGVQVAFPDWCVLMTLAAAPVSPAEEIASMAAISAGVSKIAGAVNANGQVEVKENNASLASIATAAGKLADTVNESNQIETHQNS